MNEVRDEVDWNNIKSPSAGDQIFENIIINDNLSDLKARDVHILVKLNVRYLS